jgi:predicted Zn finger-like uncharacterized protein
MEIDIDAMMEIALGKIDQKKAHIDKVASGEDDEPATPVGVVVPSTTAEDDTSAKEEDDDLGGVLGEILTSASQKKSESSVVDQLISAPRAAPGKVDMSKWQAGVKYLTCPSCFSAYLMPEEIGANSQTKVKCKACGVTFNVQGAISELPKGAKVVKFPEELQKRVNAKGNVGECKVVVRNLPFDAQENEVRMFLEIGFGPCKEFFALKNPDGSFKGMGFAKFDRWYDAKRAIDASEARMLKFKDRPISIAEAYDQKPPVRAR